MTEQPTTWRREESRLYQHALAELTAAGLFKDDSDYGGMLGKGVLDLVEVFAKQGHSGMSAAITVEVFSLLARFQPLGPLTDNPDEWLEIHDGIASEPEPLWQNRRKSSSFSHDGGKTYYDLDEPLQANAEPIMHFSKEYTKNG